jgi:L-lactate dehydrogenase complex protein LldG
MSDSRAQIINRLRAARPALGEIEAEFEHLPVVPRDDLSSQELVDRFVEQSRRLDSDIHMPSSQAEAIQLVLELLGEERRVCSWAFDQIPLPGLEGAFTAHGIQVVEGRDATLPVGITGADAALASTGSLVLQTGKGKARLTSLLPPVHIAVIRRNQILIDLEDWIATIRQQGLGTFREAASVMIISGPSRTADIAMQTIMGMHGPGELHIIIVN